MKRYMSGFINYDNHASAQKAFTRLKDAPPKPWTVLNLMDDGTATITFCQSTPVDGPKQPEFVGKGIEQNAPTDNPGYTVTIFRNNANRFGIRHPGGTIQGKDYASYAYTRSVCIHWHDKTLAMLERRWRRRELIGRIIFDWVIPITCAAVLAALTYAVM